MIAVALLEQAERGIPERSPQPADLLAPAAGEDSQHPALRRDPETRARRPSARPWPLFHQRMSHVLAPEAQAPEERLLEGKHHGQAVDRGGEAPRATWTPGPELGRNVVEHFGPRAARGLGDPDVEAGIVDQDDQVIPSGFEIPPE